MTPKSSGAATRKEDKPTPLRVLILEDRPDDAELMAFELGHAGFDVNWQRVETRSDYEANLNPDLDVVLADYSLPQFDALQALILLQDRAIDIPFIVVTGSFEDLAIDCMKQGASDYLIKDRLGRLGPAVRQALQDKRIRDEKRRAEEALRRSESRFRSVAETAIEAIVVTDGQGNIQYWNKAAEQTFGYPRAEALSTTLSPMIRKKPRDGDGADAVAMSQDGEFVGNAAELVGVRKGGELFPIELSRAEWKSEGEQFYSNIMRDLTEAHKAQERALQQDRMAAVGQLVAGIAPNFTNILGAIILHSEMVLGSFELNRRDEDRIRTILKQAERGAFLARQILDFGRQASMDFHPIDLVPFVQDLETAVIKEGIRLSVVTQRERYVVSADASRLQQALMNLALNAQEAMQEGGELRFELDSLLVTPDDASPLDELEPGEWIRIRVVDTGIGIDEENLSHVFEPFFTTKPSGQGVGLGLAQVYGIVKQHGGHIEVKSSRREGTEFIIYLPAAEEGLKPVQVSDSDAGQIGSGQTVLVVDDDEPTRVAVCEILESLNYRILQAEDGQKALRIIQEQPESISLVLTDLVMPNMGGVELLEKLRALHQDVPFVLMTSYPLGTETHHMLDSGLVAWLEKPLTEMTLARTIRSALSLNR